MTKVRIIGFSLSPRHGNTEIMVKEALQASKIHKGIETEFISLQGKIIKGCSNCRACIKTGYCIIKDDWKEVFKPLIEPIPEGVIIGAPVYFYNLNSQARAFMERTTSLMKGLFFKECPIKPPDWTHTASGVLTVGFDRNGGQEHAMSTMLHWLLVCGFVAVGGGYPGYIGAPGWQMGGSAIDSVKDDIHIGIPSARHVGKRVGETAILLKTGVKL